MESQKKDKQCSSYKIYNHFLYEQYMVYVKLEEMKWNVNILLKLFDSTGLTDWPPVFSSHGEEELVVTK